MKQAFGEGVRVYGNPLTAIASLMGVAAQELTSAELETYDYPVVTCVVARRQPGQRPVT